MNKKNEQEENKVFAFIAVTPRTRNSCPKAPHRTPPTQNHFNNHPQTRFREKLNQPPTPISLHVKCPNATDSKDFKANISLGGLMLPVVLDSGSSLNILTEDSFKQIMSSGKVSLVRTATIEAKGPFGEVSASTYIVCLQIAGLRSLKDLSMFSLKLRQILLAPLVCPFPGEGKFSELMFPMKFVLLKVLSLFTNLLVSCLPFWLKKLSLRLKLCSPMVLFRKAKVSGTLLFS